jgi:nucleoside-diphosphate-sugar epimerase
MRVFVAGVTGAIGRRLMPRQVAAGHEVHGMTRSESKQALLYELGAVPLVADAFDRSTRRQEADAGATVNRRLFAGEAGVVMMTEIRGASNAKAKRELRRRPAHPSWRRGFAAA